MKRMLEEQQDSGFALAEPWRGVCPACIDDPALQQYVISHDDVDDKCGFCRGPGPSGVHLDDLFQYMAQHLAVEWDDPNDEVGWDSSEGGWQLPDGEVIDSWDLLEQLGDPLGTGALREAFVDAFQHQWCPKDPYRLRRHQMLGYSWDEFARYVRLEGRYLFLRSGRSVEPDSELIEPADFLDEFQHLIVDSGLIRKLGAGSRLWRARQHLPENSLSTAADLGSPPPDKRVANRMSPAGISMFYAAEDIATALTELHRDSRSSAATVAAWVATRDLRYLDLVDVVIPSIFHMDVGDKVPGFRFLRRFTDEVARPVSACAGPVDYVPTQIVTELVRHLVHDHHGNPVEGIRYRSAVRPGGVSWVLFIDANGCSGLPDQGGAPRSWLALDTDSLRRFRLDWQPDE